jgi:uncharacterized protein
MRLFISFLFALGILSATPNFPTLTGPVVDEAALLTSEQKKSITQKLEAFHATTDAQVVVAILESLQGYEISDFGYQLGRHWGIGSKDKNNGILLIVAPKEREVRIEVGYGLEGVMSDYAASKIIQSIIIPQFKSGDVPTGIAAGVDAIIKQIANPNETPQASNNLDTDSDVFSIFFWVAFGSILLQIFGFKQKFLRPVIPSAFTQIFVYAATSSVIGAIVALVVSYPIFYWLMKDMSSGGGGNNINNSSGGFSSSGGFGGGFSGGGGSFGGGGSSGKW